MIRAKNLEEVKRYVDGKGTLSTARFAFEQGKDVFIGFPSEDDPKEAAKHIIKFLDKNANV